MTTTWRHWAPPAVRRGPWDDRPRGASAPAATSACPDPNIVGAFLDGELSGPALHALRQHIDDCPECRFLIMSLAFEQA